jgi:hypothetical protein
MCCQSMEQRLIGTISIKKRKYLLQSIDKFAYKLNKRPSSDYFGLQVSSMRSLMMLRLNLAVAF